MNNAKIIIFLIFLGTITPVFAQESMNVTSQINEIKINIEKLSNALLELKKDVELQDKNTQTEISTISKNILKLQHMGEVNNLNIDSIKNEIINLDNQINEIKNIKLECVEKSFDCEKIIEELNEVNITLKEIKEVIFGNSLSNLVIISISLVLAMVAIAVAIVTTRTAVNQLDQTKKEQKHKLRPILVRDEYFSSPKNGYKQPHKIQKDKILFRIKNIGPIGTTKVLMRWYVSIVQNKQLEFIRSSNEDYLEGRPLPNLEPDESYSVDLFINSTHHTHIFKYTNCIFGVILEYFDEKGTSYEYKMEGYFDHGGELMLLSQEEMEKMVTLMTSKT